jgi:hypothetical protein
MIPFAPIQALIDLAGVPQDRVMSIKMEPGELTFLLLDVDESQINGGVAAHFVRFPLCSYLKCQVHEECRSVTP